VSKGAEVEAGCLHDSRRDAGGTKEGENIMANKTEIIAEPGKQELFIIREFEAPREMLFEAYTDPEIYVKWCGPRDLEMRIETMDAVSGGSYRFIHKRGEHEYAFSGVYHEVLAPRRIIGTFEFEGLPERGHVIMGTTKFEELPGGRSKLCINPFSSRSRTATG
jgi:uncharacterized protein YndB with AHSA1/START domain